MRYLHTYDALRLFTHEPGNHGECEGGTCGKGGPGVKPRQRDATKMRLRTRVPWEPLGSGSRDMRTCW